MKTILNKTDAIFNKMLLFIVVLVSAYILFHIILFIGIIISVILVVATISAINDLTYKKEK